MTTPTLGRISWRGAHREPTFWAAHREAALNWLALGLLLAAWNASSNDDAVGQPRPQGLRGYSYVSVRAAHRAGSVATT